MANNNKHWSMGLVSSLTDPKLRVISSDKAVVIKDKFPKSRFHFLVLPFANLASIYHVTKGDLPLLDDIHLLGLNVIEVLGKRKDDFKMGYHISPSMQRLHLHVISKDFDSPSLKTKVHWNSFNTEYFLSPDYVYKTIEEHGKLEKPKVDYCKELLATELKCNQCQYKPKNMPDLKEHVKRHV